MLYKSLCTVSIFFIYLGCSFNPLSAEETKKKEEEVSVMPLPMIVVPVIQENTIKRYFALQIRVELQDIKFYHGVKDKIPRLTDKIFTEFYKLLSILNYTNKIIEGKEVKEKVTKICDALLGTGKIQTIFIDNFSMHSIEKDQLQKK